MHLSIRHYSFGVIGGGASRAKRGKREVSPYQVPFQIGRARVMYALNYPDESQVIYT